MGADVITRHFVKKNLHCPRPPKYHGYPTQEYFSAALALDLRAIVDRCTTRWALHSESLPIDLDASTQCFIADSVTKPKWSAFRSDLIPVPTYLATVVLYTSV